jgi:ATP-dependent Lon protease
MHLATTDAASSVRALRQFLETANKWLDDASLDADTADIFCPAPAPLAREAAPLCEAAPSIAFPFDVMQHQDGPQEQAMRGMGKDEKDYFLALSLEQRGLLMNLMTESHRAQGSVPLRFRVLRSRLPQEVVKKILRRLERQQDTAPTNEVLKYTTWVETLLALPLGEVLVPQPSLPHADAMHKARRFLDTTVYGHAKAKSAILERFYQWLVNPLAHQRPLAFCGCPGNGKTSLVRNGLAAIMARPFAFISLGGSMDSSALLGHSYTYEGSMPGRIVEHLALSRCMNPIIYCDELDKCSATPKGDEIVNSLIHMTDPTQADRFRDRYIGAVDIDLSGVLFVFSFNDAQAISPVLLDRLQVVLTDEFTPLAQQTIAAEHLVGQVLRERHLPPGKIQISPAALQEAVAWCSTGGVRAMKGLIDQGISKVSMWLDMQEATFLSPLLPSDIDVDALGNACVRGGLGKLAEGPVLRTPSGMYI